MGQTLYSFDEGWLHFEIEWKTATGTNQKKKLTVTNMSKILG